MRDVLAVSASDLINVLYRKSTKESHLCGTSRRTKTWSVNYCDQEYIGYMSVSILGKTQLKLKKKLRLKSCYFITEQDPADDVLVIPVLVQDAEEGTTEA